MKQFLQVLVQNWLKKIKHANYQRKIRLLEEIVIVNPNLQEL